MTTNNAVMSGDGEVAPVVLPDRPLDALAADINAAHKEAQAYASKAVERALVAGDLLLAAKAQVKHGEWLPWLAANCPDISARTATNWMRLASNRNEIGNAADLSLREALRLVTSEQTLDEFIEANPVEDLNSTPLGQSDGKQRESKMESPKRFQHDEIVSNANFALPPSPEPDSFENALPVKIEDLRQEYLEKERFEANRAAFHQSLSWLLQGAAIIRNPADCKDPTKWKGTWDAFHSRYCISDNEARGRLADLQARIPFLLEVLDAMQGKENGNAADLADTRGTTANTDPQGKQYYEQCREGHFISLNSLLSGSVIVANDAQVEALARYRGEWDVFTQRYRHRRESAVQSLKALQKNLPALIAHVEKGL
jgi:hypothetical protein